MIPRITLGGILKFAIHDYPNCTHVIIARIESLWTRLPLPVLLLAWFYIGVVPGVGRGTFVSASDVNASPVSPQEFIEQHCQSCHLGTEPKGDFDIGSLTQDFAAKEVRDKWLNVSEQLKSGAMPPEDKPRPAATDVKSLVDWIVSEVTTAERASQLRQGRSVMRRLNQIEYENTIRDLLQVDVDLTGVLPIDEAVGGFDTSAELLHMSSYQMNSYLTAANLVLDSAVANGPRPTPLERRVDIREESVTRRDKVYRHLDDGLAIFASDLSSNIQIVFWNFQTRHRGQYRFRISAYAYQTDEPVLFHINGGTNNLGDPPNLIEYFEAPPGPPTVIEFVEQMEAGRNIRLLVDTEKSPREVEREGGVKDYQGPGLVVQWVEMEGPLGDSWPPPSHRLLFGELPQAPSAEDPNRREVVSQQPLADAEAILRKFTRRAFRRTVTEEELQPFLARVRSRLDEGTSFERAVRVGLKAVLISPNFLYLRERTQPIRGADSQSEPGLSPVIDDFALASRLSYFLWSSMPDDDLLQLAEDGKLRQPETLRLQVERMLNDPKAKAFTENFAGQWLSLRNIDATQPDQQLYPEYDDLLRLSMLKEAYQFFDEVLQNDLSLTNFVSSDFSVINGRLAKHYGIQGVDGLAFRKVQLPPESHRGGFLTMAATLKVTANGTTTSPIVRGAWVLDRILGTPPPRPPANIEAIEPDIRGATTIRDQMAKHRSVASCATCHVEIDPPGFALENFDVIGGWRDRYRSIGEGLPVTLDGRRMRYNHGPEVDAADVLADGRRFDGIDQYKELLLADREQLAGAMAHKLVTYATGTPPSLANESQVKAIVEAVKSQNYGFRSLIHAVVQSDLFQNK